MRKRSFRMLCAHYFCNSSRIRFEHTILHHFKEELSEGFIISDFDAKKRFYCLIKPRWNVFSMRSCEGLECNVDWGTFSRIQEWVRRINLSWTTNSKKFNLCLAEERHFLLFSSNGIYEEESSIRLWVVPSRRRAAEWKLEKGGPL